MTIAPELKNRTIWTGNCLDIIRDMEYLKTKLQL